MKNCSRLTRLKSRTRRWELHRHNSNAMNKTVQHSLLHVLERLRILSPPPNRAQEMLLTIFVLTQLLNGQYLSRWGNTISPARMSELSLAAVHTLTVTMKMTHSTDFRDCTCTKSPLRSMRQQLQSATSQLYSQQISGGATAGGDFGIDPDTRWICRSNMQKIASGVHSTAHTSYTSLMLGLACRQD